MVETHEPETVRGERWIVTGRVQGVFYRAFTREAARALGLSGWVRNLADGSVELQVAGAPEKLAELERRLRRGPPASAVEILSREPAPAEADVTTADFEIRY